MNLMLLDCSLLYGASDEANFIFKWCLFLLLPLILAARYQVEYRVRDWWAKRNGEEGSTFTYEDAMKAGMFLMNGEAVSSGLCDS